MKIQRGLSIVFSVFFLTNVYAGDAFIYHHNFRSVYYFEKEDSVKVTFKNDEDFDVSQFSVYFGIWQEVALGDWQLRYEWSKEDLTVEANSMLEVKSETTWKPEFRGRYQLVINSYSAFDIDLSNNYGYQDFFVGDYKRVSFKQLNFKNPYQIENSTTGRFGVKLPPRPVEDGVSFINVLGYKPEATNSHWIVKNLPVLPFDDYHRLYYYFDLGTMGFEEGEDADSLWAFIVEDSLRSTYPLDYSSFIKFDIRDTDYDVVSDNGHENTTNERIPQVVDPPRYDSFPGYEHLYIGCRLPNIDLDSGKHKASETYAGDLNACGPAAAANSMHWLEETNENIPSTGSSHREKMEELSGLMDRGNERGVTTDQLVKGKLAYIDKHKLPIHVKYQSWFNSDSSIASPNADYGHFAENKSDSVGKQTPPTWEFLKSEVKKGEDVEILFGWYDRGATRNGGHWVAVSGFFDSDSLKGIYFKDDGSQSDSAGTRETFIEWRIKDEWSRLVGFDGPNNYCWVESVVSESYDESVTFEEPISTQERKTDDLDLTILNNPSAVTSQVDLIYSLEKTARVSVQVIGTDGRIFLTDSPGTLSAGKHHYSIPASTLNRGQYFVVVKTEEYSMVRRLVKY